MKIGSAGDTINHLLLHCLIARVLGSMVFTLFAVSWVMPKDVVELTASWPGKFRKHRNGVIWNLVPHCLMWGIWRERNAQIFEGTERAIHELKMTFLQTFLGWTNASSVSFFTSLTDLLDSCSFCTFQFLFVLTFSSIHVLCALVFVLYCPLFLSTKLIYLSKKKIGSDSTNKRAQRVTLESDFSCSLQPKQNI